MPEEVVRRRYRAGLRNFFSLYRPLATTWRVYDNGGKSAPRLIASGQEGSTKAIAARGIWKAITEASE